MSLADAECNSCRGTGGLHHKKVFRFSTPIVAIGVLLLIPSLLGVSCGACGIMASGSASTDSIARYETEYKDKLGAIPGLSPQQVTAIVTMDSPNESELRSMGLSKAQIARVDAAHSSKLAGQVGAGAGAGMIGGASLFILISSFIGGLLGWLLLLRRKIIACRHCDGVHSEAV